MMPSARRRTRTIVAPRILVLCAMLTWCSRAFALDPSRDVSQYAHTTWKIRDGFVRGVINSIAQTRDGYLWLGTDFGLLRFDGVRNVLWEPPHGRRVPSNAIHSLLAGRDGTLWIGTRNGLVSWKGDQLIEYGDLAGQSIATLLEDREGTVWVGGIGFPHPGRLCAIRNDGVRCYGMDGRFASGVNRLYEDSNGTLWAATSFGVWQWRPGSPKYSALSDEATDMRGLAEDGDGSILVGTRQGVVRIAGGKIARYPLQDAAQNLYANRLLRDRDGGLWIGTSDRVLHVHNGRTDVFGSSAGFSGGLVTEMLEDREGNVWVATSNGLDRFHDYAVATLGTSQGLSSPNVYSILADNEGRIWLSTTDGLNRWSDGQAVRYVDEARELFGLAPGSLFLDDSGRIWVSTRRQFGYLEKNRFVPIPPSGRATAMAQDAAHDIWLAIDESGLVCVRQGAVIQRISWKDLGHTDPATSMVRDPLGDGVWLGFSNGGVGYFAAGRIRTSYTTADGLGDGRVNGIRIDRDGTFWAATAGGLSRFVDGRFVTLDSKGGLPCNTVHWMIQDDDGALWLYMPCGLIRIGRAEIEAWTARTVKKIDGNPPVRVTLFDSSDGVRILAEVGTLEPQVVKSADGKLWFLPWDGVSVVDPRHLLVNTLPPPVHIEQVTADRKTYDASTEGNVRLPSLIHDLEIDYTALSLVAPEKTQFRYKLEGRDREWQEVGTRRQAFYSNLAPRTYRFRVSASNNSGVWNEGGASLVFSVSPAYYQTNWFRMLSLTTVLALVWAAHRVRLRIVEQHEREISALNEQLMKAQEEERTRIAIELHDGVMQEMLAATMMLGSAKRQIPDDVEGKTTIDKVQQKLVQVGTDLRQLSHELHPPMLQEVGLPGAVCAYCEQFSASCGVPISCEAEEAVQDLSRGAALALFRIVQEGLGNAAKHAAAKQITVRLTRSDGTVSLVVSDDGMGFDRTRLSTSRGLGLITIRERAGQLNGTFEVESTPGRGTTIRIVIPFR